MSTLPSSITDNGRVDNSLVGCGAVLRCLLIGRRGGEEGGGGHSSSSGANVVVQSNAIAVEEFNGPGDGEETRRKVVVEAMEEGEGLVVESMEEGDGWGWVPKALL